MIITAKINGTEYGIKQFSLRYFSLPSDTNCSAQLSVTLPDVNPATVGGTVELYSNGDIVYTGLINNATGSRFTAVSDVLLSSDTITAAGVIFYSDKQLRVPIYFNIIPGCTLITDLFTIQIGDVTHYQQYSDVFF